MRRFAAVILVGLALVGLASQAGAILISYGVDVGNGYLNDFVAYSASKNSALVTRPLTGTLDVPATGASLDMDVSSLFLDTDVPNTGIGETIHDVRPYKILVELSPTFINPDTLPPGGTLPPNALWTQTVNLTESDVKANSAIGHLPAGQPPIPIFPTATQDIAGMPFTLRFKSFDFPGSPQFEFGFPASGQINPNTGLPYNFEGSGGKTDMIATVPEPGNLGMLLGSGLAGSLFLFRRRRQ